MSHVLLLLTAALCTTAQADDRDDEIFGTAAPPPADEEEGEEEEGEKEAAAAGEASPPGPAGLSDDTLSDSDIADRLREADKRFTMGGLGYLRLNGSVAQGQEAADVSLSSPSFMELYADGRPNDRLRFYSRGRMYVDPTVDPDELDAFGQEQQQVDLLLDQLWLNFDIGRTVFVTAGKQRIKWGAGRLWNPTDFLAPAALDSLAFFDERTGVGLIKLHLPLEKTGTNLYAIAELEGADSLGGVGGALRLEQLLGPLEVALSAAAQEDQPEQLGAQLSLPIWLFDLRGELALSHGISDPTWQGGFAIEDFGTTAYVEPTSVDRSEAWVPQAVAALELTVRIGDEDSLTMGAEYFYNDLGYDDASLYPWLILQGQYTPFYLGRHYAAAYLYLPAPGRADDHSFTLTGIGNLSDETVIGRLDWSVRVLTELSVNSYVQVHGGPEGGEFAFAIEVPAIPGVLDEGLSIDKPLVDVGVGAQVRF